ncbi:DUF5302 domain-containing protein [Streptomyces sp. LB8]|uniref:DUF5302 domain-containing protein n=1 Tax=Streptomyces sp. LB8 TaxID=3042509 RepID=UPI00264A3FD6|nr:DUF5302 domain-containing protein [Streptomyces sp. LB8]MDN5383322.1 DUF5302 domain-containing protein [Streptomyces sp. LB8]
MADVSKENKNEDPTRDKFREALERKKSMSRARQAHEEGRLKVKSMSGPAGKKRYFRRKTG